ncbi:MAG: magnesium transporter, partial [Pseudomonadota bacterium]
MIETVEAEARAEERDDDYALDPAVVNAVVEAIDAGNRDALKPFVDELHVADLADLVEQLSTEQRRQFIALAWADLDPELLIELEEGVR